ncbi:acyltransferase [soil metagenome]
MPIEPVGGPVAAGSPTVQDSGRKLPRVQILRLIAAGAVILSHALGTSGTYYGNQARIMEIFRHGDLGVDLFFVISGFVIGLSILRGHTEWRQFLLRRLARIVPLYWLVTLFTACLFFVPGISRTAAPEPGFFLCSLTYSCWMRGEMPIVYPGWSLEYEMYFYVLTVAMLALRQDLLRSTVAILSGLVVLGVILRANLGIPSPALAFLTDPIVLEFVMGLAVAFAFHNGKVPVVALIPLAVALLVCVIAGGDRSFRLVIAGVPSALIVYLTAKRDSQKPMANAGRNPFVWLGDASYAIYLVHAVVVSATVKIALKLVGAAPQDLVILVCLATTLAAAAIVDLFIDRPIARRIKRLLKAKAKKPVLPGG